MPVNIFHIAPSGDYHWRRIRYKLRVPGGFGRPATAAAGTRGLTVAYAGHRSRRHTAVLYAVTAAGTAVLIAACGSTARPAQSAGPGATVLAASSATISETGSSLLAQ